MPAQFITIGPFAATFIGDAAASTTPLSRILAPRTEGITFAEDFDRKYVVSQQTYLQNGLHVVTLVMTFASDTDDIVENMSRGVSITSGGAAINTIPYAIFLLNGNATTQNSYFFPRMMTKKVEPLGYTKNKMTITQITLEWSDPDPNNQLYYKDDADTLVGVMGDYSPISAP